ncbi:MAG: protein phosphatase 2C domain-containing protein [Azoarcus sp.]|jgi:protein phosphatase|nr:protein phosphatase 2C domain-containing protein [Azoarcus sp.]
MPNNDGASRKAGLTLECAVRTDVGLVRERNEDTVWADPERGWLLLADGMGGYHSGDLASALAVNYVLNNLRLDATKSEVDRCYDRAWLLAAGIADANTAIRAIASQSFDNDIMGSTFVGALLSPDEVAYAHIGDSRLYLFRDGVLTRLSRDHTVAQEYVDAGRLPADMAQTLSWRGLLTRGLGIQDDVEPGTGACALQPDDRLLLCSDGLTDMAGEDEIATLLGAAATTEDAAAGLIEAAKAGGGRDNISVIVAWFAGRAS